MKSPAKLVLSCFSCIGLGSFTASLIYIILLAGFKEKIHQHIFYVQWVWRLLFGLGLIPLVLTLYARLTMKESKPYEQCK